MKKMLILSGISHFGGKVYPHGAIDEPSALAYATKMGYQGVLLNVPGDNAGEGSAQHLAAVKAIKNDLDIEALYGFSGGGYNVPHVLDSLNYQTLARLKLVVVLGAPKLPRQNVFAEPRLPSSYGPGWVTVYRNDPEPPAQHMDGPRVLLASSGTKAAPKPVEPSVSPPAPTPQPVKVGFWARLFGWGDHG